MRVEKNLGEYTIVYYREEFHPITTDRPRVLLINHFARNRFEERYVFDFQNINEYNNLINMIMSDEIHYNIVSNYVLYPNNRTILSVCDLTINNRMYQTQHEMII